MTGISKEMQALIDAAAEIEDQTVVTSGGDFEQRVPPEGLTVCRFVEYIEMGLQPRTPYQGKERTPAETVRISFELTGPKNGQEITKQDGETIYIPDRITLTLNKSFNERAKYKKLFDLMRAGRSNIVHMAQMLNEGFMVTITHNVVEADKKTGRKERTYANITDAAGAYTIGPPRTQDPMTGDVKKYKVPEAKSDLRVFIWEQPTAESWESLFIDGTRTVKHKDGTEEEISKNWLQETIIGAVNFSGSPLEQFLMEGGEDLNAVLDSTTENEEEAEVEEIEEVVEEKPKAKKATKAKTTTKKSTKKAKEDEEEEVDPLAELGLID